jgi:hypothetical protein
LKKIAPELTNILPQNNVATSQQEASRALPYLKQKQLQDYQTSRDNKIDPFFTTFTLSNTRDNYQFF